MTKDTSLNSYSPSDWESGRMQGNLESEISHLRSELQNLAATVDGQESRIKDLEREVDRQKTKIIALISGISFAVTVGIQITLPLIDKFVDMLNKGGKG